MNISIFDSVSVGEFLGYYQDTILLSESVSVFVFNPFTSLKIESLSLGESITAVVSNPSISVVDTVHVTDVLFPQTLTLSVTDSLGVGESISGVIVLQIVVSDHATLGEFFDYDYTKYPVQILVATHPGSGTIITPQGKTW